MRYEFHPEAEVELAETILYNESQAPALGERFAAAVRHAIELEVGDRSAGDSVTYPDDDIQALLGPDGKWRYSREDGMPYRS